MIGVARVHPMRFYSWAPFDSQNEYSIKVSVDGRELSAQEITQRYHIRQRGVNPRSLYEYTSLIAYVEEHYRPGDRAQVEVTYRTNGSPEQQWHWPAR